MLAEKFVLVLETRITHTADAELARHPDGSPKMASRAPHIPIRLPNDDAAQERPTKH
ncbi:hypothetical protein H8B02_32105 [Bradyrhizobium sp. Pear77]|uniref:hypothetical protein n=1 Tax=Bradyrhizobium altum TaxID=1571202 RepID=UPI001E49373D|nr:hypothetical protein [Bradyrhizobium altum]MCC8957908.1 hypothetical protein [Bradyrhizobium altum]